MRSCARVALHAQRFPPALDCTPHAPGLTCVQQLKPLASSTSRSTSASQLWHQTISAGLSDADDGAFANDAAGTAPQAATAAQ